MPVVDAVVFGPDWEGKPLTYGYVRQLDDDAKLQALRRRVDSFFIGRRKGHALLLPPVFARRPPPRRLVLSRMETAPRTSLAMVGGGIRAPIEPSAVERRA
jgi:hypothetical protein